jgi:glutamate/tyrosine decarboxylase-like PLP-dependent enzyme
MRKDDLLVQLENLVREHPDFEVLHEPTLDGYCFRCVPNGLVERQEEPEVQALLDVLNEQIVQAVQRDGFAAVVTIRVQGRAAIQVSFYSGGTLIEEVDATFEAIARWGRLLDKKLSVRYEPDMETKLCSSESHFSPTEVSAT